MTYPIISLQMNANNQTSSSLKQIKIQMPIATLEFFTRAMDELYKMYPTSGNKLEDIPEQEED